MLDRNADSRLLVHPRFPFTPFARGCIGERRGSGYRSSRSVLLLLLVVLVVDVVCLRPIGIAGYYGDATMNAVIAIWSVLGDVDPRCALAKSTME